MGLFSRIPKQIPQLIETIAKELPWKLGAEGAASIELAATRTPRAAKLIKALEPEFGQTKGLFGNFKPGKYIHHGESAIDGRLEITASGELLEAIQKHRGFKPPSVPATAARATEEASKAAQEVAQEVSQPSGMDLIKRGDQKPGLQL